MTRVGTALVLAAGLVAACSSPSRPPSGQGNVAPSFDSEPGTLPQTEETRDPATCEEAKATRSYVGCDYWPTVTANAVWSIFDYAVVVANSGGVEAEVKVTGPNAVDRTVKVAPGQLQKIFLPWVPSLKGPDTDECTTSVTLSSSVLQTNGAYHLVSSVPVIVYQFNALEYRGAGGEGPNGTVKDWSACPGQAVACAQFGEPVGCFSFSNDASLLLPSTAMTGNYRVLAHKGWTEGATAINGTTLSITATSPDTEVTIALSATASVLAGDGLAATGGGNTMRFTLANAGDVAELVTAAGAAFDFSGSLVQATHPVQVISGAPCVNIPAGIQACDHIEESVLPAETLGRHYFVHPPTGPGGEAVPHVVRLFGNRDGTALTYQPARPPSCPETLGAGQMADCDLVDDAFEIEGTQEFGVASFLVGAQLVSQGGADRSGDPDMTTFAALEQFRTKYLFLSPDDYTTSFADVTAMEDSSVTLDGVLVRAPWVRIGSSVYGVRRVPLEGKNGSHVVASKKPMGLQVLGYGDNTSYHYPGGLNLKLIAAPPPPVR